MWPWGSSLSKGIKAAGARFRGAGDAAQAADADVPAAAGKNVTLQKSDGSIVTKSVDDVAAKPQDLTHPAQGDRHAMGAKRLRAANRVLKIKDPSQVYRGPNKKPAWKPTSWTDTAGEVLTMVQSPSKQNYAPESELLESLNLLNAGQWSNFDKETVAEFAAGTVGKTVNKTLPIEDATASKVRLSSRRTQIPRTISWRHPLFPSRRCRRSRSPRGPAAG